jgi:predicted transcriptional regulator
LKKNQTKDSNCKELRIKRIDWAILTSIVQYLYYHPYENKTNLATKIGLQYSRFVKYLTWLHCHNMIDVVKKDGCDTIILNKKGIRIAKEFDMLDD